MQEKAEFEEIAHCGGKVTFSVKTDDEGRRSYQIGYEHCRPVACGFFAVYAIPQGVPVGTIQLGGIGQAWNSPPIPGCIPVFIASDSEGKYGHQCQVCQGYWRSDGMPSRCPYCGLLGEPHEFLTPAQRRYLRQYCYLLAEGLKAENDGDHVIDMDAVADAAGKEGVKPPFYYTEESQQNKFTCNACGQFNDILGTFGYCSFCGTRNDLQELDEKIIPVLRIRINSGGPYEDCVRDAVAVFDSLVGRYIRQLLHIPMTSRRAGRFEKMRFHNLKVVGDELKTTFDIDILDDAKPEDIRICSAHVSPSACLRAQRR